MKVLMRRTIILYADIDNVNSEEEAEEEFRELMIKVEEECENIQKIHKDKNIHISDWTDSKGIRVKNEL